MKTIIFLRHSEAENKRQGIPDHSRKLTRKGIILANNIATKLKKHIKKIHYCFYSPAERTKDTAKIFCEKIGYEKMQAEEGLYYNYDFDKFFNLIYSLEEKKDTVLIVGHNFFITKISMYFSNRYDLFLHPSSLVVNRFDVDSWLEVNKNTLSSYLLISSK